MNARTVKAALYRHFAARYAVLTELATEADGVAEWRDAVNGPLGATPPDIPFPEAFTRRVDVLLVGKTERIAVEVKVTRRDFLAELRNPAKQNTWRALAHRHAYAAPAGLLKPEEIPDGSGLLIVHPTPTAETRYAHVQWARRAPKGNAPPDLPPRIVYAVMHRCAHAEAVAKGLVGAAGDAGSLRLENERLRADLATAHGRADRARELADAWRTAYAAHEPPQCATCELPITPDWSRNTYRWRHTDPAAEPACEQQRRDAWTAANPNSYGFCPSVVPADPEASK